MVAKSGTMENTTGTDQGLDLHNRMSFTTHDRDQDFWDRNCGATFPGGWWFKNCHTAYLNGKMATSVTPGYNSFQLLIRFSHRVRKDWKLFKTHKSNKKEN